MFTVIGRSTRWTFPSDMKISRALSQRSLTSFSEISSNLQSFSICLSRSLMILPLSVSRAITSLKGEERNFN